MPCRPWVVACLIGAAGASGCAPGLRSIAPAGLGPVPLDTIQAWLGPYRPSGTVRYQLRWRFVNQKGSTAGRAVVRIAPPDSVRFDYRGPFGRSGAVVVVADSALWMVPERETQPLVPAAPLFWAALGNPQPPPPGVTVFALGRPGERAWRYAAGTDTTDFVEPDPAPARLLVELRREGRILASVEVRFRPGTRIPAEARLRFPQDGSVLLFTVEGVEQVAGFAPDIWRRP